MHKNITTKDWPGDTEVRSSLATEDPAHEGTCNTYWLPSMLDPPKGSQLIQALTFSASEPLKYIFKRYSYSSYYIFSSYIKTSTKFRSTNKENY